MMKNFSEIDIKLGLLLINFIVVSLELACEVNVGESKLGGSEGEPNRWDRRDY